jgi:hypothetical protein
MDVQEPNTYVVSVIGQMQDNETKMKGLLQTANLMTGSIEWKKVGQQVRENPTSGVPAFESLISNLVDVYAGLISNCSMFASGCAICLDFMEALPVDLPTHDAASLDWIFQQSLDDSTKPDEASLQYAELERLILSFESLSTASSTHLKSAILLSVGLK